MNSFRSCRCCVHSRQEDGYLMCTAPKGVANNEHHMGVCAKVTLSKRENRVYDERCEQFAAACPIFVEEKRV